MCQTTSSSLLCTQGVWSFLRIFILLSGYGIDYGKDAQQTKKNHLSSRDFLPPHNNLIALYFLLCAVMFCMIYSSWSMYMFGNNKAEPFADNDKTFIYYLRTTNIGNHKDTLSVQSIHSLHAFSKQTPPNRFFIFMWGLNLLSKYR